ncbi:MAG: hypothetical protein H6618_03015 [Deltaproteobacteria bacterium]|nr:hypothetical protein [Deltaproteobacteria bacterium]
MVKHLFTQFFGQYRTLSVLLTVIISACEKPALEEFSDTGECRLAFHFYQKDSFQEYPKRVAMFWPPHTTTELDIRCQSSQGYSETFAQNNHGTGPDKIVKGIQVLQKIKTLSFSADESSARKLMDAYRSCQCPGSYFSMELLSNESKEIFSALGEKTKEQISCTEKADIAGQIRSGKFDPDLLSRCSFDKEQSWKQAFGEALHHVSFPLDSYHVCNNDAKLQEKLIREFIASGDIRGCAEKDPVCAGPLLYYQP